MGFTRYLSPPGTWPQDCYCRPSGSGKSTLLKLALRFWDSSRGSVLLDGQDIRQYAQNDLRSVFSVVDQDTISSINASWQSLASSPRCY